MHNLTRIAAVLLMLLGLALGIYAWMLSRSPAIPPPAENAARPQTSWPLVVAAKPLPAGIPIKSEDLRIERLTIRAEGSFGAIPAVVGQVPSQDIGAGMPISDQQLSMGLASKVADGERAIAVKVDEVIGVGNRLRPGDWVDVFYVVKRDGQEVDRSKARLLLARRMVLAYGGSSVDLQPSMQAASGAVVRQEPPRETARTAVLSVPLAEASQLALAASTGSLLLALRNPADRQVPDGKAMDVAANRASAGSLVADVAGLPGRPTSLNTGAMQGVAATAGRAVPRDAAAGGGGVEIIRGGKREVVAN